MPLDSAMIPNALFDCFEGMRVVTNSQLTETRIEYPGASRFVEYTGERGFLEQWYEKHGYAKCRQVPSKQAYRVGSDLVMHPATWEKIKTHLIELKRTTDSTVFGLS